MIRLPVAVKEVRLVLAVATLLVVSAFSERCRIGCTYRLNGDPLMSSLVLEPLHPRRNNRRRTNRSRTSRRFRFDLELLEGRITPTTPT